MTYTIETTAEDVRAKKVEQLKTGHFSYTNRAGEIKKLVDTYIAAGKLDPIKNDYSKLSGKERRATGLFDFVVPVIKARYPHHASEVHVMTCAWNYVFRLRKLALKTAEEAKAAAKAAKAAAKAAGKATDKVSVAA